MNDSRPPEVIEACAQARRDIAEAIGIADPSIVTNVIHALVTVDPEDDVRRDLTRLPLEELRTEAQEAYRKLYGPRASDEERDMQPADIRQLMAGMRFEPQTNRQWREAEAGAAAMDRDWEAKAMPKFVNGGLLGAGPYYRAAYELRYHELLAASGVSSRR